MVGNTGRAADTHRIRRLKPPRVVEVEASEEGVPARLRLGRAWQDATPARRPWRVDQHWWRGEEVSRLYYRVLLEDGQPLTLYFDIINGGWFQQEY